MKLTQVEMNQRALSEENLEFAVRKLKIDGCVVIEGALTKSKVDRIFSAFCRTLDNYIAKHGYNRGANRAMMHLPFAEPFIDPDVIENPYVLQVLDRFFDTEYFCRYFSSDTALPGSEFQKVHSDHNPNFPDKSVKFNFPEVVFNIPLVDVTAENGPLEIWPGGTHKFPIPSLGLSDEQLARLSDSMHHEQVFVPAGTLIIRDLWMWHRGTPNRSRQMRPNFAQIYTPNRRPSELGVCIPQEEYDKLSGRAKQLFRLEKIGSPAVNLAP